MLFALLLLFATGCGNSSSETGPVPTVNASASTTLSVQGMTCESCAVAIRTALANAPGVGEVSVDVAGGAATVEYDPAQVSPDRIAAAISDLGYPSVVGDAPATAPAAVAGAPFGPDPTINAICQAGCAAQVDYEEADLVVQPNARVGDLTRCPVSGVVFYVKPDQAHVDVGGKNYFTCCDMCAGKLTENPSRFVRL